MQLLHQQAGSLLLSHPNTKLKVFLEKGLTLTVIKHLDSMYPGYNMMRIAFYLYDHPLQTQQYQSNHEKNIIHIPVDGHSTKVLARTPQNCQGHKSEKLP